MLICFTQTFFIAVTSSLALDGCFLPLFSSCNSPSFGWGSSLGCFQLLPCFSIDTVFRNHFGSMTWCSIVHEYNVVTCYALPCVYSASAEIVEHISGHLFRPSSPKFAHVPQTIWPGGRFTVLRGCTSH